jgi:secreted trypsin-like serine protease
MVGALTTTTTKERLVVREVTTTTPTATTFAEVAASHIPKNETLTVFFVVFLLHWYCNTSVGDSGGPLIARGNSPEEDLLVGIVSWYVRACTGLCSVRRCLGMLAICFLWPRTNKE